VSVDTPAGAVAALIALGRAHPAHTASPNPPHTPRACAALPCPAPCPVWRHTPRVQSADPEDPWLQAEWGRVLLEVGRSQVGGWLGEGGCGAGRQGVSTAERRRGQSLRRKQQQLKQYLTYILNL
jgi:hypothetical protein